MLSQSNMLNPVGACLTGQSLSGLEFQIQPSPVGLKNTTKTEGSLLNKFKTGCDLHWGYWAKNCGFCDYNAMQKFDENVAEMLTFFTLENQSPTVFKGRKNKHLFSFLKHLIFKKPTRGDFKNG